MSYHRSDGMKKLWIGIGVVVIVALAIVLIVTKTKKEPEDIKIGAILPLTGDNGFYVVTLKKEIDSVKEEINSRKDIKKKKLKVIYEGEEVYLQKGGNECVNCKGKYYEHKT